LGQFGRTRKATVLTEIMAAAAVLDLIHLHVQLVIESTGCFLCE
jgi:hypothetical protein